ncbi:tripartite tricarboxylate transporter substrate binding protein [Bordetella sp. FB-8]|uniref:Bug family tripartite tricarboxylate transporter substrate binding protein n=1 Tax=Bordetella sp. FB-8 TaxID=1159870 RepID=UPI000382F0FC|nr:tripartite tricarboxylate transporter substrate binding protein [Bordetella sp. FB-8]
MRTLIRAAAALLLAASLAPAHAASDFPKEHPIDWIVPYPAGGGTDIVARTLQAGMSKILDQNIVVENKPGAATAIGAEFVAHANPDGYSILSGDTATLSANPPLYPHLGYDPQRDFTPIGMMARFNLILVVNPALPIHNMKEFMTWAKAQKNGVHYATPGTGTPHHLATALFALRTGLNLINVPYRGAAPAIQDVMSGQVPMMFVDSASGQQYIASGKLRALAVASKTRLPVLPNVPTLIESGLPGFEAYAWQGLVAPKGTPEEIVNTLNAALNETLKSPEVIAKFKALSLEITPSTPRQLDDYARAERAKWTRVIQNAHITIE